MNSPAGTSTISGQSAHSLKVSFDLSSHSRSCVSEELPEPATRAWVWVVDVLLLPLKENSAMSEEDTHGICSLLEARDTPMRTRLNNSSAVVFGDRSSLSSSLANGLFAELRSTISLPGAAENIARVLSGASSAARPAGAVPKRRSEGFCP